MKATLLLLLVPSWLVAQGLRIDDARYADLPQKRSSAGIGKLPARIDLSMYAPEVINQGDNGTCVAVSVGYYMRTILEAQKRQVTSRLGIGQVNKLRFSPWYLYNTIKEAGDTDCKAGIDIGAALEYIKQKGLPAYSAAATQTCEPPTPLEATPDSRLLDYVKLFGIVDDRKSKELATKKALSELAPVVVGIQTTPSLKNLALKKTIMPRISSALAGQRAADRSTFTLWRPELSSSLSFGHAMCVVGYDDTMFGTGAFKLINSWGTNWGDNGYFWIAYADFGQYAKYGYQAYVQTTGSPTDIILSADIAISTATFFTGTDQPVERIKNGATLAAYRVIKPQRTGTPFKFSALLSKQTYLYLITANSTDEVATKLFPEKGYSSLIGRDTRVELPNGTLLRLEGTPGLENWLFLFSETAIDIDDYIAKINAQKGPFSNRVQAAFGDALAPYQQISYKDKKMGFFLKSQHRGRIVPLLVSMNHVK